MNDTKGKTMNNCIQGNLIIFDLTSKCGGKDKSAKPCYQLVSEDYQKLKMSVMKKIKDKIIMAAALKNPAGKSRKAAQALGWRDSALKNSGVFDKIPKGMNLLFLPHRQVPQTSAVIELA
jgi:hypothetical protein